MRTHWSAPDAIGDAMAAARVGGQAACSGASFVPCGLGEASPQHGARSSGKHHGRGEELRWSGDGRQPAGPMATAWVGRSVGLREVLLLLRVCKSCTCPALAR